MKKVLELFPFLGSNRFHALVLLAVAGYLKAAGFHWDAPAFATALEIIAGGHILVRSTDRFSETLGKK